MKQFDAYIICTSPRSGSTLLCRMLAQLKTAGSPDSHFHEPSLEKWLAYHGLNGNDFDNQRAALTAVFHAAQLKGRGDSDIFGLRLQRDSFDFFVQQLELLFPQSMGDKDRIEAAFGRTLFVHLSRANKLNQAISVVTAMQSGLWHMASDGTEIERSAPAREPIYNAKAITAELEGFIAADKAWETWFEDQSIEPLKIPYEALSQDPYGQLQRVADALGVTCKTLRGQAPPLAKLANERNKKWSERYRSDHPDQQF
ncbi:Stf0 family sulfotransferase [Planktotalea sp.]|uniref:Stf0 family sulfotransferase n=1 Tax=Planktotalea sp. TaxID=2029877 RepID=UPI0032995104